MSFVIHALPPKLHRELFAADPEQLAAAGACKVVADSCPGYPCRISLADAACGEELLLVSHTHRPSGPYAAKHAVFLRLNPPAWEPLPGEVPKAFRTRTLSLRSFDTNQMMQNARLVEGRDLHIALHEVLSVPHVIEVDIHFAAPGCFAARAVAANALR